MTGFFRGTRRFVISGRVQGVGFRAFAARAAHALNLEGAARNRPDGAVEIVATGPEHALDRFEAALHEGSRLARVDGVFAERLDGGPVTLEEYDIEF